MAGYRPSISSSATQPTGADLDQLLKGRRFFIVSVMNGKVLDIHGGNAAPNTKLIMWDRNPAKPANQLWYFDSQGVIYSALNGFVFQSGESDRLRTIPYTGEHQQQWFVSGDRIMNKRDLCLDIAENNDKDGAELCAWAYKDSKNQHWRIEYE